MDKAIVFIATLFVLTLVACLAEPETVEVTRAVAREVEVTRIIVVTRIVEVEVTPTPLVGGVFGSIECDDYINDVDDLLIRWQDAVQVASATARVSLSGPVADLQSIKREARDLSEPFCAGQIGFQDKMTNMMDTSVETFVEFMAGGPSEDTFGPYELAVADYSMAQDLFLDALQVLQNEEDNLPRRIHYYVLGQSGFDVEYIDESGEFVRGNTGFGRLETDEMPVVYTVIIPEEERAAVKIYNPRYVSVELNCVLYANGVEMVSKSDTAGVTCEYP